MASIMQLKRRIKTAKSIAQLTRALEMVAASKMRRAKDKTLASRPYAEKLSTITASLSQRVEDGKTHDYFVEKNGGKTLLLVFSPDKGLCGGLISNLFREFLTLQSKTLQVVTIGKKLQQKIIKSQTPIVADFPFGTSIPSFDLALLVRNLVTDGFLKGEFSKVVCLYTKLENIFSQKPQLAQILPIRIDATLESKRGKALPYLFEPNPNEILDALLPYYLEIQLFQMLLESYASEQAARATAMHNATENAKEVVDILTLEYNKARQEKVTNEILDIVTASLSIGL